MHTVLWHMGDARPQVRLWTSPLLMASGPRKPSCFNHSPSLTRCSSVFTFFSCPYPMLELSFPTVLGKAVEAGSPHTASILRGRPWRPGGPLMLPQRPAWALAPRSCRPCLTSLTGALSPPALVAEEHVTVDARVYAYALALQHANTKPFEVPFLKF